MDFDLSLITDMIILYAPKVLGRFSDPDCWLLACRTHCQ
jgi:hypothetical protein